MRLSIVHKISLLTITLVVATAGVISGLFYQQQKKLMVEQALDTFSNEVAVYGVRLQDDIENVRADAQMLASVPPIQGLLRAARNGGIDREGDSTTQQWKQRLQTIFHVLLEAKRNYMMARFLTADGRELVRVDQAGGRIFTVPDQALQDKAGRDYVIDTLQLPEGQIYLSEINLNREHGQLETPYREVLRGATPVFDEQTGTLAGMVVLNIDIGTRFRSIGQDLPHDGRNLYITNDRGDYLLQPDPQRTFGFDHGVTYRLQDDFPSTAGLFLAGNVHDGLRLSPQDTRSNQAVVLKKFHFDPDRPGRYFTIGISQHQDVIIREVLETLNRVISIAAGLILLAALLSILLSLRLARPIKLMTHAVVDYGNQRKNSLNLPVTQGDEIGTLAQSFQSMSRQVEEAESRLRNINQHLESLVAERTRELTRNRIRQQVIVESMADGLISIDAQGLIKDFNPAAETIFQYRANEVVGHNIAMLLPESVNGLASGKLRVHREGGDIRIPGLEGDVEGRRRDGSTFPMELSITEIIFDNEHFYSGIVRDITERKAVERMKNEFISTVSHELRTPLTSIRGSLGLLLGGAVGELPGKAREMLEIAGNNSARLLSLINDLLDIQKIESGKMSLYHERFALMPFLEQAVTEHLPYGQQYDVRFVITDRLEDAQLYSDQTRLTQVIGNLLSNAAKFSPPGATVTIAATRPADGMLRIAVHDSGPGIPPESMATLFERFTQIDSSDTRARGGTGLGLTITKAIVEKLGGTIGVESGPGKGSTFYFDLPEAGAEQPAPGGNPAAS